MRRTPTAGAGLGLALRCIGSTTFQEYRGIFEKTALARRFQKIDRWSPPPAKPEILRGLKPVDMRPITT